MSLKQQLSASPLNELISLLSKNAQKIDSDEDLLKVSDTASMTLHNQLYDRLLVAYVDNVQHCFKKKQRYKQVFFWCSLSFLGAVLMLLIASIILCIVLKLGASMISALVPVSVSFLTVFIVIPQTINKYLFNEQEEEYMTRVIGNIQGYDKEIRKNLNGQANIYEYNQDSKEATK